MNKPHKWCAEIKAWADGATIQYRIRRDGAWMKWMDDSDPSWYDSVEYEYRVKPVPIERWLVIDTTGDEYIYQEKPITNRRVVHLREVMP